jgi:tetraprenyl-beta-curcumene synthase
MTTPTTQPQRRRLDAPAAIASVALSYALTVFPRAARELAGWRARAEQIPDPVLRGLAAQGLSKRGNMFGAALFAVLAPHRSRAQVVRALVAFQSAYNYLDMLAEQPSADPLGNGRRLHGALLHALDLRAHRGDYYAGYPHDEDGGFLGELVAACQASVHGLPSYALVVGSAKTAAARIVDFQSLNLGLSQGGQDGLERWARARTPPGSDLSWWETAAAGGSSLAVHALLAVAARPGLNQCDSTAIEEAYFPSIGALHSLLDSVVDVAEDERQGQRSLVGCYPSSSHAARRLRSLAHTAARATATLPDGRRHRVILTAMAGYYLSSVEGASPPARALTGGVTDALGGPGRPTLSLCTAARSAARLTGALSPRRAARTSTRPLGAHG